MGDDVMQDQLVVHCRDGLSRVETSLRGCKVCACSASLQLFKHLGILS